ncbi:MAG: hypothetical protein ABJE95_39255 [Byssovorax sp.]
MIRSPLPLLFLATASVALFACGSDTTTTSTSGTGGSTGTTTATSTGAGGGSTTSTSTGTGTASSSGTGAGPMMACTNAADAAVIMSKDVKAIVTKCGQDNVGAEPQTKNCIKTGTGLSDDCTLCYSNEVDCVRENCLDAKGKCLIDPNAQLCLDCRKMYCSPAYEACSGNKSM